MCLLLIAGIVLSAILVGHLVDALQRQKWGDGAFVNPARKLCVVVTGEPDRAQLLDLLAQLYHREHAAAKALLHAVVLLDVSQFSAEDARYFAGHYVLSQSVTYLRGSVSWRDLQRAGAHTPEVQAIYILIRGTARDDTANLLRATAVARYLPRVPLYVSVASSAAIPHLRAIGVPRERILARDKLLMGLLAANCITPGAAPLLMNLLSAEAGGVAEGGARARHARQAAQQSRRHHASAAHAREGDGALAGVARALGLVARQMWGMEISEAGREFAGLVRGSAGEDVPRPAWHAEYAEGLAQEIYEVGAPVWLLGCTLREAVLVTFLSPLARLLLPDGDAPPAVAPPRSLDEAVGLLATHPALAQQTSPLLIGATMARGGATGAGVAGSGVKTAARRWAIQCDLASPTQLTAGDVLYLLLGDIASAPLSSLIERSGLVGVVRGLLRAHMVRRESRHGGQGDEGAARKATGVGPSDAAAPAFAMPPSLAAGPSPPLQPHVEAALADMLPFPYSTIGRAQGRAGGGGGTQRPALPVAVALTRWDTRAGAPTVPVVGVPAPVAPAPLPLPAHPPPRHRVTHGRRTNGTNEPGAAAYERFAWPDQPEPTAHGLPGRRSGWGGAAVARQAPPAVGAAEPLLNRQPSPPRLHGSPAPPGSASQTSASPAAPSSSPSDAGTTPQRQQSVGSSTLSPPPTLPLGVGGDEDSSSLQPASPHALQEPPAGLSGHLLVVCDDGLERLPLLLYPLRLVSDRDIVVLSLAPPDALVGALAELRLMTHVASDGGNGGWGADAGMPSPPAGVRRRRRAGTASASGSGALDPPLSFHGRCDVSASQGGAGEGGRIFYVRGDALIPRDLQRAHIGRAIRVVVLNSPSGHGLGGHGGSVGGNIELDTTGGAVGSAGGEFDGGSGEAAGEGGVVDARAVLATVLIESRMARRHPALVASTTTEISSNSSFRLMGRVPQARQPLHPA